LGNRSGYDAIVVESALLEPISSQHYCEAPVWLIMPLIFFVSWRSCRRVGQAFSETASWAVGYLVGTGVLLLLHYGGSNLVSANPDDPTALVAVITGFIGMWISRYLWKRRGGHLEPVNNPLTNSRWFRAARAIAAPPKKAAPVKRATTPTKPRPAQTTTQPSTPPATKRPAAKASAPAPAKRPAAKPTNANAVKLGRVIGAMLQSNDTQRRPPQR
jgi:cell division septation protein DedD